jgi:hypothetical protein
LLLLVVDQDVKAAIDVVERIDAHCFAGLSPRPGWGIQTLLKPHRADPAIRQSFSTRRVPLPERWIRGCGLWCPAGLYPRSTVSASGATFSLLAGPTFAESGFQQRAIQARAS